MEKDSLILVSYYCQQTRTSTAFLETLESHGFIKIRTIEAQPYVTVKDIEEIERVTRLKEELGINLEGIEALDHMLQKMNALEKEIRLLRDRLRIYEP